MRLHQGSCRVAERYFDRLPCLDAHLSSNEVQHFPGVPQPETAQALLLGRFSDAACLEVFG